MSIRRTLIAATALVAFICGLALQCGCDAGDSTQASLETALQETVREYNRLLIQGFSEMDMAVLEPAATQEQAEREYVYMAAVGEGRMRIDSTLVSLEFGVAESLGETATIDTHEVWDYRRVNMDTGVLMAEEQGVEYDLRYTLIRVSDRWVVAAIDPLDPEDDSPYSP